MELEPRDSFLEPSLRGERAGSLAVVVWWGSEGEGRPLALMSEGEGSSEVGLREILPDLAFPECLFLRALHSSPAAPRAGNTLGLRSSAWSALILEFSSPGNPGLRTTFGVRAWGLEPGLGSVSLHKKEEETSERMFRRGGGVRVPFRGAFSPFCSLGWFPPKVPESKWRWPRSRGSVTDFHSVPSEPLGMLEDQRKRLVLDMGSSSLGGVVAAFPPGPGTAGAPFLRGNKGPG
ncbi:hypothetical protein F7725_015574 [Dissostichus mawsoni]|uniref:Uncharacterized protein n=1 Tax=Dissostichus mawsoni TaxID=36200 RepID=A0A7J5YKR0_DISMA|nr:hypothetical protein F7725_015574 [Dissostichus mawsoni]